MRHRFYTFDTLNTFACARRAPVGEAHSPSLVLSRCQAPVLRVAATALLFVAGAANAYKEVDVAGGGSIQGKVVFNGTVPMKTIIPTKDAEICGAKRKEPQILVTEDKSVRQAVVYLKGVKEGKAWGDATAKPVLDQKACRFEPKVQIMPRGDIDIVNSDPVLHNTHGYYGRRTAFNLALPNEGQTITRQLKKPGIVKVDCDAHGWMLAHIYVADNPYYALSGEDGTFNITDVPPGDYTLVVWQRLTGATETAVKVEAEQAAEVVVELKK